MATETGRKTTPLECLQKGHVLVAQSTSGSKTAAQSPLAHLAAAPQSMALGQALRLLGMEHTADYAAWSRFMQRRVRVRSWLSLAFPSTELAAYQCEEEDGKSVVELTSTGFGLYGTLGPLPTFYTEELLEEARSDESVSRDFLDIINNRLHHCLHKVTLWGRVARCAAELQDPRITDMLHCLMGRAYPSLRPEGSPQIAVLSLLLRHTRSAMGLEEYCTCAFGFAGSSRSVRVEQCVPRKARIPESQRCRLGQANSTLGTDLSLGEQVPDCTGKFRLHFSGLSKNEMERFLPAGPDFVTVDRTVRQYLDVPLEYDVVLHPAVQTGFRQRLGDRLGGYLLPDDSAPTHPVTVYHSA